MRTLSIVLIALIMTGCGGEATKESTLDSESGVSISSAEKSLAASSLALASSTASALSTTSALSSSVSSTQTSSKSSAISSVSESSLSVSSRSSLAASSKSDSSISSSVWVHGKNDQGFTLIKPSSDSRLIYVSDSGGNDANDCLSEAQPCKTIEAGRKKMRAGYPDHLYLKRGDIWRDQSLHNFPSGRSVEEPAVIAFYGTSGDRPRLENANQSTIGRKDVGFIHIIGLEFVAYKLKPSDPEFTGARKANIVMIDNHHDILFEDNKFDYVEVVTHPFGEGVPRNIRLRRNIWTGAYSNETSYHRDQRPSNIYAKVKDNFELIENVFDNGGWHPTIPGAGANMYNHNIYLQGGAIGRTVVRGNIVTRASSHGIQMRSGGLAEDNFFARNAIGLLIGYQNEPPAPGTKSYVINNVVTEGHSMVKGVDACTNNKQANLCTAAVWGIDVNTNNSVDVDWLATGNIISQIAQGDELWKSLWNSLSIGSLKIGGTAEVKTSDNIIWKWSRDLSVPANGYPDPDRTLADYNEHLGGENSFEEFMEIVLNRPLQTWDEKYSAYAINDYIREGFGISDK